MQDCYSACRRFRESQSRPSTPVCDAPTSPFPGDVVACGRSLIEAMAGDAGIPPAGGGREKTIDVVGAEADDLSEGKGPGNAGRRLGQGSPGRSTLARDAARAPARRHKAFCSSTQTCTRRCLSLSAWRAKLRRSSGLRAGSIAAMRAMCCGSAPCGGAVRRRAGQASDRRTQGKQAKGKARDR